jgi:hypothetical protein
LIELAPGVQMPVAALESAEPLSVQEAALKDGIAGEFGREVGEAAAESASSPEVLDQAWSRAQVRANERFRLFFGDQAYNRESIRAGRQALAREPAH